MNVRDLESFRVLVNELGEANQLRGDASHIGADVKTYDEESEELDKLRELTLGIDRLALISRIEGLLKRKP